MSQAPFVRKSGHLNCSEALKCTPATRSKTSLSQPEQFYAAQHRIDSSLNILYRTRRSNVKGDYPGKTKSITSFVESPQSGTSCIGRPFGEESREALYNDFVSAKNLIGTFDEDKSTTNTRQTEISKSVLNCNIFPSGLISYSDRGKSFAKRGSKSRNCNFTKVKSKSAKNCQKITNYFRSKPVFHGYEYESNDIDKSSMNKCIDSSGSSNINNNNNYRFSDINVMATKRSVLDTDVSTALCKRQRYDTDSPITAPEPNNGSSPHSDFHESFNDSDDDCFVIDEGDKYGLLGTSKVVEPRNYFENLPVEVLENIFCMMTIVDIYLVISCVCKQWRNIVTNPEMPSPIPLDTSGNDKASLCCCKLPVWYMKTYHRSSLHSQYILHCLQSHHKYPSVLALFKDRLQTVFLNENPDPCSVIAGLVILSTSVRDITSLISLLTSPTSHCSTPSVLDVLYCIAALLLACSNERNGIWNRMHYRLYYALHLYENQSTVTRAQLSPVFDSHSCGQQTITKYSKSDNILEMTHEQLRICKHNIDQGEIIKIVAFAGTGKTTTLLRYAQLRPNTKFLLVVFNKSVCQHSKKIFPSNVECRTSHSLAYSAVGYRYRHKLLAGSLNVYTLTQILEPRKGENLYVRAKHVQTTLNAFMASSDPVVKTSHVPTFYISDDGQRKVIELHKQQAYVDDTKSVWDRMKDLDNNMVRMTHDGYLKLYQLEAAVLSDFDVILIDEAQDLTPAVADILLRQPQGKVLVGDPHQQIYSFRGATNVMSNVAATHTFYLTQSFRFGPEIARVAACCLERLKKETTKTLIGNAKPGWTLGRQKGQLAIITRCNYTLFAEAVKKCYCSDHIYRISFVGGLQAFGLDMLEDIYTLMLPADQREHHVVSHKFLRCFNDLSSLEKYATKCIDVELLGKIRIVRAYMHQLPACVAKIRERHTNDHTQADILMTTAHKAKGLEFDTVCITDDFSVSDLIAMAKIRPNVAFTTVPPDEDNLLYVAITRAKHSLIMSPLLHAILQLHGDTMEEPTLTEHLKDNQLEWTSALTKRAFTPGVLTLRQPEMTLSTGKLLSSGLLSPEDAWKTDWAQLLGVAPSQAEAATESDSETHEDDEDENEFLDHVLAMLF